MRFNRVASGAPLLEQQREIVGELGQLGLGLQPVHEAHPVAEHLANLGPLGDTTPGRGRQVLGEVLVLAHDRHRLVEVTQLEERLLELGHRVARGHEKALPRDPGLVGGDLPLQHQLRREGDGLPEGVDVRLRSGPRLDRLRPGRPLQHRIGKGHGFAVAGDRGRYRSRAAASAGFLSNARVINSSRRGSSPRLGTGGSTAS